MAEWSFSIGSLTFNLVDIIIFVIILINLIAASIRGFAITFSKRLSFFIGLLVAVAFAAPLATLIANTLDWPLLWSTLLAVVVIFAVAYILVVSFGNLLASALETLHLSFLDHILGAALGVGEALVVVAVIIYLLNLQKFFDLSDYFNSSLLITRVIGPLMPHGESFIKGLLANV
ncbi:MAG: CvpA family protein [Sphaerochaetaceae bacterium]